MISLAQVFNPAYWRSIAGTTMYLRFAQLTAPQKAAARKLWVTSTRLESTLARDAGIPVTIIPLVDCYFRPVGDGVHHGYFEFDPTTTNNAC